MSFQFVKIGMPVKSSFDKRMQSSTWTLSVKVKHGEEFSRAYKEEIKTAKISELKAAKLPKQGLNEDAMKRKQKSQSGLEHETERERENEKKVAEQMGPQIETES